MCSTLAENCLQTGGIMTGNNTCAPLVNMTSWELEEYNVTVMDEGFDLDAYSDPFVKERVSPTEEYWL